MQLLPGKDGLFPTIPENCEARLLGDKDSVLKVTVGAPKLGRVFDYLDRPRDGLGAATGLTMPVFNEQPVTGSTESLTRGLHTGITAVDSLTPIGKGQTMLVVGPSGVGRTELALDAVQAQAGKGVPCVWACLHGQAPAIRAALQARGCLHNTALVEAPEGAPPAVQFATAAAALSAAEVLVSLHAHASPPSVTAMHCDLAARGFEMTAGTR